MDLNAMMKAFLSQMGTKREAGERPLERSFGITVKAVDEKARSVRVVASSEAIDSYGEIVKQNFRLERYERNPVVLYGHNQVGVFGMGGDPEWTLPVGYATDTGLVKGELESTLNFVTEKANPFAELVWQSVQQGSLRAVSIGFYPHTVREEIHDDEEVYVLDDNELFEISVVPMGANPDAVALNAQRTHERAWLKQRAAGVVGSDWLNTHRAKAILIPPAPSPEPLPPAVKSAATENSMTLTPEQIKKLQDDHDAAQRAITAKDAEINALNAQGVNLKSATDAATARADKAEAKVKELEGQLKAKSDADADAAIDAEVQALVGVKLSADQKATFVKLRKESPDTFKSIVDGLPELTDKTSREKEVDEVVGKKFPPAVKAALVVIREKCPEQFTALVKDMPELAHTKAATPPEKNPTKTKTEGRLGTSKIVENSLKDARKAS
jgi:HK97 family phage prohead protease